MKVRKASFKDSEEIADILKQMKIFHTKDFYRKKIKFLNQSKNYKIIVAEKEKKVVGLAAIALISLLHAPRMICRVTILCVSAKVRGEGIGRVLLKKAEQFGRVHYCHRIEVTSHIKRTEAHRFYKKNGYLYLSKRFVKDL